MKVTFLGTRGNIEVATERHRMHTSSRSAEWRSMEVEVAYDGMERVLR